MSILGPCYVYLQLHKQPQVGVTVPDFWESVVAMFDFLQS